MRQPLLTIQQRNIRHTRQLQMTVGGRQTRLTLCGIQSVVTTGMEWGVAERLKSGVAPSATNPSVDVQSVPVVPLIQTTKMQETITKKTLEPSLLDSIRSPTKKG
jgi:hypothetical protein